MLFHFQEQCLFSVLFQTHHLKRKLFMLIKMNISFYLLFTTQKSSWASEALPCGRSQGCYRLTVIISELSSTLPLWKLYSCSSLLLALTSKDLSFKIFLTYTDFIENINHVTGKVSEILICSLPSLNIFCLCIIIINHKK